MGSKLQGNKSPLKLAHSPLRPDFGDTERAAGQWGAGSLKHPPAPTPRAVLSVHSVADF